jgi:hypothetical protein
MVFRTVSHATATVKALRTSTATVRPVSASVDRAILDCDAISVRTVTTVIAYALCVIVTLEPRRKGVTRRPVVAYAVQTMLARLATSALLAITTFPVVCRVTVMKMARVERPAPCSAISHNVIARRVVVDRDAISARPDTSNIRTVLSVNVTRPARWVNRAIQTVADAIVNIISLMKNAPNVRRTFSTILSVKVIFRKYFLFLKINLKNVKN